MANYTVRLRSVWCNHDGTNHPLFADHYAVPSWFDVTGAPTESITPPNPTGEELEAVMDAATLTTLQDDVRYTVVSVTEIIPVDGGL